MNKARGILPIIIALIVVGTMGVAGGGYTGVRYYQSEKLRREADKRFESGQYDQALELYNKSFSRWKKAEVKNKLEAVQREKSSAKVIEDARQLLYKSSWQECVDRIKDFPKDSKLYTEAQNLTKECTSWLEKNLAIKKAEEDEAAKKKAEEEAAATKSLAATKSTVKKSSSTPSSTPAVTEPSTPSPSPVPTSSSSSDSTSTSCQSNNNPTFTAHLTDTSKISSIAVPPRIVGGHLKNHSYVNTDHQRVPIYAPADMKLKGGVHLSHGSDPEDYGMDFEVSCEVTVRIGHITDPIQSIKDTFPTATTDSSTNYNITPISFKAGDLLGYTTGTAAAGNWDYGVYNSSTKNRYTDDPDWNNSWVYTTSVCPYDYFSSGLKSAYSSKYISEFGVSILDGELFCK